MNTEFIPYEQALELKELGFNEPCFGLYAPPSKTVFLHHYGLLSAKEQILAPLYQQAFSFFRKKCLLEGIVEQADDFCWYKFSVYFYNKEGKQKISNGLEFETYEEAELACLNKLIEIVKNK
jgi:hypothetical protein